MKAPIVGVKPPAEGKAAAVAVATFGACPELVEWVGVGVGLPVGVGVGFFVGVGVGVGVGVVIAVPPVPFGVGVGVGLPVGVGVGVPEPVTLARFKKDSGKPPDSKALESVKL